MRNKIWCDKAKYKHEHSPSWKNAELQLCYDRKQNYWIITQNQGCMYTAIHASWAVHKELVIACVLHACTSVMSNCLITIHTYEYWVDQSTTTEIQHTKKTQCQGTFYLSKKKTFAATSTVHLVWYKDTTGSLKHTVSVLKKTYPTTYQNL
jgi:hypothetical protein